MRPHLHRRLLCGFVAALLVVPAAAVACVESLDQRPPTAERPDAYVESQTYDGARAADPSPACTVHVSGTGAPAARAGDTVCFTGDLPSRLTIREGGTAEAPITYSGGATTTVPGITVEADHVVVEGFIARDADDTGIWVSGNGITVRDNEISAISLTDDDVDAIRFFGDDITIARNRAHDVWANPDPDRHPHVDCMQTFAHAEPASSNVRIEGNRCEGLTSQCVMAEGPNDFEDGASGVGESKDWVIAGNFFECHAEAQTVQLQDIHNVTFSQNTFAGTGNKAIALGADATGATVTDDNVLGPGYGTLVDFDHESARTGYTGPSPGSG